MATSPESPLAINETTGLLQRDRDASSIDSCDQNISQCSSSSSSFIDNPSSVTTYGTPIKSDEEEQRGSSVGSSEPTRKIYNNGFIAKVVIALLVGALRSTAQIPTGLGT